MTPACSAHGASPAARSVRPRCGRYAGRWRGQGSRLPPGASPDRQGCGRVPARVMGARGPSAGGIVVSPHRGGGLGPLTVEPCDCTHEESGELCPWEVLPSSGVLAASLPRKQHRVARRVFAAGVTPDTPPRGVIAYEAVTGPVIEGVFLALLTQRFFGN